jgi:cell division protein FtsZ
MGIIKVIGVGHAGINTVNYLENNIREGVEYVRLDGLAQVDTAWEYMGEETTAIVLLAGLGGSTGSRGIPDIALQCKERSVPCAAIVFMPFAYESQARHEAALQSLEALRQSTNHVLTLSNEKLREQFGALPFEDAFRKGDEMVAEAVGKIVRDGNLN